MREKVKYFAIIMLTLFVGYIIYNWGTMVALYESKLQFRHQSVIQNIPDTIEFAGEMVHFKTPTSYSHFNREVTLNTSYNKATRQLLSDAFLWLPQLHAIIKSQGLPTDIKYVAMGESQFQNSTSRRASVGFWQFQKETALKMGLRVDEEVDQRLDPIQSTYAACKLFKYNYSQLGSWTLAAAAYNRGLNGLQRDMQRQKVKSYYDMTFSNETERYLYKLLALKDLYEHPPKYKFKKYKRYAPAMKSIIIKESISDLSNFAKEQGLSLEELKNLNPWLVGKSLTLTKPNEKYRVVLGRK